jgi:hypothetical protein
MSTSEEGIHHLQAGVAAFARQDHNDLSDAALADQISQLVAIWDQLDRFVTQMANTVIARTFAIVPDQLAAAEVARTA